MPKKKIILIQKNDYKSAKWAEAAKRCGIELIAQPGSPIKAPFFLLACLKNQRIPKAYVVRYLNDYLSISKTILRFSSELFLILLCKLFRIKLFWICHNVEKESTVHHPVISNFRRTLFANSAEAIFVTDKLLVPYAQKSFPAQFKKIDFISFGEVDPKKQRDPDSEGHAIEFIKNKKAYARLNNLNCLVLFCTGVPDSKKSLHFDYLKNLIEFARENDTYIVAIVAGEFSLNKRSVDLITQYEKLDNICLFYKFTRFSDDFVRKNVDFYWRGYSDVSVPLTIYESTTMEKPMLALEKGFFPSMVSIYQLGIIIDSSFLNLGDKLKELSTSKYMYKHFLSENHWGLFSSKINTYLKD
jgi:hypothetical protein